MAHKGYLFTKISGKAWGVLSLYCFQEQYTVIILTPPEVIILSAHEFLLTACFLSSSKWPWRGRREERQLKRMLWLLNQPKRREYRVVNVYFLSIIGLSTMKSLPYFSAVIIQIFKKLIQLPIRSFPLYINRFFLCCHLVSQVSVRQPAGDYYLISFTVQTFFNFLELPAPSSSSSSSKLLWQTGAHDVSARLLFCRAWRADRPDIFFSRSEHLVFRSPGRWELSDVTRNT